MLKDQKVKDLLKHLPYLANLKDPIFQNKVENLIKNKEDLQKYLLATEDLNKTVEESLQLAVGHGKLNDESAVRHVSDRDDPLYKYFRENDNPLDVVYRKQAKFDVQNPIIGSLLQQINKSKLPWYEETKKILDKGPDPNVFDLEDRFNKIFEREKKPGQQGLVDKYFDDDDNDDSPPGSPGVPPVPNCQNFNVSSQPPPLEDDDDDPLIKPDHENYFPFNWKIPGRNYVNYDELDEINLDENLREVFPEADKVLEDDENVKGSQLLEDFSKQLDEGEIPDELKFFSGGKSENDPLYQQIERNNLVQGNTEFLEYLATEECQDALQRDGISIHVPTGDIFIDNQNTGESLYSFLSNQQDTKKKKKLGLTLPMTMIWQTT